VFLYRRQAPPFCAWKFSAGDVFDVIDPPQRVDAPKRRIREQPSNDAPTSTSAGGNDFRERLNAPFKSLHASKKKKKEKKLSAPIYNSSTTIL